MKMVTVSGFEGVLAHHVSTLHTYCIWFRICKVDIIASTLRTKLILRELDTIPQATLGRGIDAPFTDLCMFLKTVLIHCVILSPILP